MNRSEFESALSRLFDADLDPAEFERLERHLLSSAEARARYLEALELQNALELELAQPSVVQPRRSTLIPVDRILRRRRAVRMAAFATAAVAMLSAVAVWLMEVRAKRPTLAFDHSPGTRFTLTHAAANRELEGMILEAGSRLEVRQGVVELKFRNNVRAIIQAPADLTLRSERELDLAEGTGWFQVPEDARGFTVHTSELLQVVNAGTEFGVRSDAGREDEVHVLNGKVEVAALVGVQASETVVASEARAARPAGELRKLRANGALFLNRLPAGLPHLHWSFDAADQMLATNSLPNTRDPATRIRSTQPRPLAESFVPGKFGRAIDLHGPDEFVVTDWPGILGDAPRSVAFWVKLPRARHAKPDQSVLVGWGEQQQHGENARINSKWSVHLDYSADHPPLLIVSYGGFWYSYPEVVIDDDRWHHLAVVYAGRPDARGFPLTTVYYDGVAIQGYHANEGPLDLDRNGSVIVDTKASLPLIMGGRFWPGQPSVISPRARFTGSFDELHVVSGVIDEQAVHELMRSNRLAP
jgi:ferric-dicitrate binding protein FerR (iron transport regulator)